MVFDPLQHQLRQLRQLLESMHADAYITPMHHLVGATIGGHTRHILEMIECAIEGQQTGIADYINRDRDMSLERLIPSALQKLDFILEQVELENVDLHVLTESQDGSETQMVDSNFFREILFLTDHTVHHMALIKVGLIELEIPVNPDFGVAKSTLKFRASMQS